MRAIRIIIKPKSSRNPTKSKQNQAEIQPESSQIHIKPNQNQAKSSRSQTPAEIQAEIKPKKPKSSQPNPSQTEAEAEPSQRRERGTCARACTPHRGSSLGGRGPYRAGPCQGGPRGRKSGHKTMMSGKQILGNS